MSTRTGDARFDYWKEALECSLHEAGASGVLSDDVVDLVAQGLVGSAENQSMAFGHDCAPNPVNAEIANLKRLREADQKEHEARIAAHRKTLANFARCDVSRVVEVNGGVYVERGI